MGTMTGRALRSPMDIVRCLSPQSGALYGLSSFRRSSSGSLAKFAAIRRASSLVSSLAAERRCVA